VSVEVASSRRNKVFVLGEVKSPGIFQIETEMNVVEAISHAGGFTPNANMKNVLLIRGDMDNPVLKKLDVKRAFKKGDLIHNVALLQGDILYIPSTPIANVETFFKRISNIIAPIVELERGIIFEPLLEDVFKGEELRVPAGVVR
jgi:polysaccharide export outer membrane protein